MTRLLFTAIAALLLNACSPQDDTVQPETGPATVQQSPQPSPAEPAKAITLTIAADPWCPHNCDAGAEHEGYMIDISREVFAKAGINVEYVNISWARALELVRQGKLDAVVGALTGDAPDLVFPNEPQGQTQSTFYTQPVDKWHFQGLDSLTERALLVINNYAYGPELDGYIEQFRSNPNRIWVLSGPEPLPRAVQLIHQHRADVLVEDHSVMAYLLKSAPSLPPLREAGHLPSANIFVAFSPKHPKALAWAELLAEGTRQLRQSGRLAEILAGYGLSDWEP